VARITEECEELKTHFDVVRLKDTIYTAEMLVSFDIRRHDIILRKDQTTCFG
jgi:hypothetical protein